MGEIVWAEYPTGKWHAFEEGEDWSVCEMAEWQYTGDESEEAPTVEACRVCFRSLYDTGGGWDGTGWNTDLDRGYAVKRWNTRD